MCYTGKCKYETYWGECNLPPNEDKPCIDLKVFEIREQKENELVNEKLKDVIFFLLKKLNIEFSLVKEKFIYLPDCLNISNYKTSICYEICKKIQKCEKYFKFIDKLNEGIIEKENLFKKDTDE